MPRIKDHQERIEVEFSHSWDQGVNKKKKKKDLYAGIEDEGKMFMDLLRPVEE